MAVRLFVGIPISPEAKERVERVVARLRSTARGRWVDARDAHVTTKFIGEWQDDRVADVERALATIPARAPFPVAVRGFGWFPSERSPRVLWAGVVAPELPALAADTERALTELGIALETRAYAPHLTLARFGRRDDTRELRAALAHASPEIATFSAERFVLFESRAGGHGRYVARAEYALGVSP